MFNRPSTAEGFTKDLQSGILKQREDIIQQHIDKLGLESVDFEKLELITNPSDKFEHLYYNVSGNEKVRVISLSKLPEIDYIQRNDFVRNNISIEMSYQYY